MKPILLFLAASAGLTLAGCYTSDKPLLTDANSVAPYATITFTAEGSGKPPTVLVRKGAAYVVHTSDGDMEVRLMPVKDKDNWYVAEMSGFGKDASVQRLFGYLHVDLGKKTAEAYESDGETADVGPGLRACDDSICIDDLTAYIAHAQKKVDGGEKPDTVFDITVE